MPRADSGVQAAAGRAHEQRIGSAERALAALDTEVRGLLHSSELCDAALRRHAIQTAGAEGPAVALRNLLLFEATSTGAIGGCASREAHLDRGMALATRCLDALVAGGRGLVATGSLTSDIVLSVVATLRDESGDAAPPAIGRLVACGARGSGASPGAQSHLPAGATRAIDELCAAMRCESAPRSVIIHAALMRRRLAEIGEEIAGCEPLARLGALLVLRADQRPFLSFGSSSRPLVISDQAGATANEAPGTSTGLCDDATTRFADEIVASVGDALRRIERITTLTSEDARRIGALSKASHSARRVHVALQRRPIIGLPLLLEETGLRVQAATSALHRLRGLGIVREITGRYRHRVYSYDAYVELLGEDP